MFRLTKLFVSDITAGENLLRNGFIPISRENELADHGVLFAENGTCKTTLLSFILNVFCPGRKRFVQHLQSGGDKTMEQYLIPGRPAIILLDLVTHLQPDLFESEPVEHLVLGQLLYRHFSAPDKVDRTFFIAKSDEFFEQIRRRWDELLTSDQPYKTVRDFIHPEVQHTRSQKEWTDKLETLGLDPWLMDRQVDFARTEGGIKESFKFRSESDFLSFFLGCVADMEAAVTLRDRIGQDLQKMEERPQKLAQLEAARHLKERISGFDDIARQWRQASRAVDEWHAELGEAAHLLQEANRTAEQKKETLAPSLTEAETGRKNAFFQMETAKANGLAARRFQLDQEIQTAETQIQKTGEETARHQSEDKAVQAAGFIADIRTKRVEEKTKEEALNQAGKEMAPMQRIVDERAAQYHARLDHERKQAGEEIGELRKREKDAEADKKQVTEHKSGAENRRRQTGEKRSKLSFKIREAEARRKALPMEPGELPQNARARLKEDISGIDEAITRVRGQIKLLDEETRTGDRRWRKLQTERSDGEAALVREKERMEAEKRERSHLLEDSHLKRMAGASDFEPTSAELVSRLDDAVSRSRDRLEKNQRSRMALENELNRLNQTETLAADDQTRQLIAHYHETGISAGELKSFPEYLAGLYEDPDDIAVFIDGDPARFTGIMAATEAVIEKVRPLPVPEWLHRPVVISTPCPPDELTPVAQTVIRPENSQVYSKRHMAEIKIRKKEELETLVQSIEEKTAIHQGMENSSRKIHAYRERYPDKAAVFALTEQVRKREGSLKKLAESIREAEEEADNRREQKNGEENRLRTLGGDLVRHTERLNQVEEWLDLYSKLESWQDEEEELAGRLTELDKAVRVDAEKIERIREEINRIRGDIRDQENKLKGLDDRAGDVVCPHNLTLSEADRKAALLMDLQTLRKLHEAAREDYRQMSNKLGIDLLRKELETLQDRIARRESGFRTFQREHPYENDLAEIWAARGKPDRDKRRSELDEAMRENRESNIRLESEVKYQKQEAGKIGEALSEKAKKGIIPNLSETDMTDQDLDALLHRLQNEETRHAEAHARLSERCRELEGKLKRLARRHNEIQLAIAETRMFDPVWDKHSPRFAWPDLLNRAGNEVPVDSIQTLRKQVKEMIASEKEAQKQVDAARRKMRRAFDRFQTALQDDAYRRQLPAVVDELRGHDAESLGLQAQELIQRCEDMARIYEKDLETSDLLMKNLVNMLLQYSREYHNKLRAAARVTIPEDVFVYGGKPILKAGTRLDFTRYSDVFRKAVSNWLEELMQQNRLPEVNPKAGNCLGSELLYQLLGTASAKKTFGIRLLKCDDTGRNYEPVGKDLGSGGEALTIAVLLYSLLISMRKKRRQSSDGRIPAFLVLDNPLGVCNKPGFIDAQLKMARALGLQCVYLTGLNVRESLDLFELRVAIRKGRQKLEIDNITYDCLEIVELNVEKNHGTPLA